MPEAIGDYPKSLSHLERIAIGVTGVFASDQETFSIQDQMVNILGFMDHTVSVATIQLSHCS